MKKKKRIGFIRSGDAIPVNDIIHLLKGAQSSGNEYMDIGGDSVKITSARYSVFQRNLACKNTRCNHVGSVFYKEKAWDAVAYHLNLYAISSTGEEILMTKDHRIPRSKGGKDIQSNYDTMCTYCNGKKGNKLI